MILFLDFDGVLHPAVNYDASRLLCNLPRLEAVLRNCSWVDVVVSSTWRERRTLEELQSIFSPDIGHRVIGMTPQWREIQDEASFGTYVRQAEIEAWLRPQGRVWEPWVAVDDQPNLFRPFCKNLLVTSAATGLTCSDCEVLLQRLRSTGTY